MDPGYVAIDVPQAKVLLGEDRIEMVNVKIIGDDGRTRRFQDHTPIADALGKRQVSQDALYVMTVPGMERKVAEIAKRHLFS